MPNIAEYVRGGDRGASLRYAAVYALSAVSVLVLVLIYCFYAIQSFGITSEWKYAAYSIIYSALKRFFAVLLPSVLLALLSGYYGKGTKRRLLFRSAQYVYWISALAVFASAPGTTLYIQDASSPIVTEMISISIDLNVITYMMILIPVFQIINAVLEYLEFRSERGGTDA